MAEEILLTKEGYEAKQAELEDLVTNKRQEIAQRLKEAISYGDISENSEYDSAKNEQAELEDRISKLESILEKAKIIEDAKGRQTVVSLGVKVKVRNLKTKKEEIYVIVGSAEADPFEGRISNESLVGQALLGHKAKEKVSVQVPDGVVKYEIVSIGKA
ncbi:MAG: transcription elongation factor GreA [Clostridiales Family XIII bacterium]|jgi:transcription elongation factor GreA|nr:transcription elongation factor GreA [Clostridiales Family XIII bacterium]